MEVKLQLAIDVINLSEVIKTCEDVEEYIDVFEAGTLLCLSQGIKTVKILKNKFDDKVILADIRIVKAGEILSDLAFKNNADVVTVISDCDEETLKATYNKAKEYNKDIQIEINTKLIDSQMKIWKKYQIKEIILHRHSELQGNNKVFDMNKYIGTIKKLGKNGFKVGITGGITKDEISLFKGLEVASFIIGREILKAKNPKQAAKELKDEILLNF